MRRAVLVATGTEAVGFTPTRAPAGGTVFFDEYPRFLQTSETAAETPRLNLRHRAIIEANRDILAGARVLDLASHDGRWSLAALKAGAAHVIGVEARKPLVRSARETFAYYGVEPESYQFIRGDMFKVFEQTDFEADVVICLGFAYHTLRYADLFAGIRNASPRYLLIDTKVVRDDRPLVEIHINRIGVQSHAARDDTTYNRKVIAGWPSLAALEKMLDVYDFELESRYDWEGLLTEIEDRRALHDYDTGERVTLRFRAR